MNTTKKRSIVFLLSHFPIPRFTKKINILKNKYKVTLIYWNRSGKKNESYYGRMKMDTCVQTYSICLKSPLQKKTLKAMLQVFYSFFAFKKLFFIRPNIIHTANIDTLIIARLYKLFYHDTKIIYEVGDLPAIIFNSKEYGFKGRISRAYIAIEKYLLQKVSKIILTSPYFWQNYYIDLSVSKKYYFLPNAPLTNIFKNFKRNKNNIFTIGLIGSIRFFAQIKLLIDVVEKMNPQPRIFIAGNGPDLIKLKSYIEEREYIEYYGSFNYQNDAVELYQKIDCVYSVYDSKLLNVRIALPNRLYDSILTSTPIIASKNTVLGDFIENNKIGFQVNIAKPDELSFVLSSLMNKFKTINTITKNCQKLSENFTHNILAKQIIELYENI